jgi:hypothetical protein
LYAVDHPAQALENRKRLERKQDEQEGEKSSDEEVDLL